MKTQPGPGRAGSLDGTEKSQAVAIDHDAVITLHKWIRAA
jgi:hypothetical protein